MAFRNKTKSKLVVDERQTLDAKHNSVLQNFTDEKKNVDALYYELSNVNIIFNELNEKNKKNPIFDIILQKQIWDVDDKMRKLQEQIYKIENSIEENIYMLKTGKLLSNYYKILDNEKQIASNSENGDLPLIILENTSNNNCITVNNEMLINGLNSNSNVNTNTNKKRSILDWFQNDDNQQVETELQTKDKKTTKKKANNKANDKNKKSPTSNIIDNNKNSEIKEKQNNLIQTKDEILEKYMKYIDKNYININPNEEDMSDTCSKCVVEMLLNNNTGQLICPKCGLVENIIVDSDKPSFKEPPKEMTSFCYKRINHLNEFLAQFQAKETTDIPEDVYNEILMEIKKERITNMALITPEKMRTLLKKIKKNDYYEHIPYIINQLNGLPAPVIAPEIEEIIRGMFKAIQIPFEKYCPAKRKNFLSYNYVMYKFFELLELDEYLDCFQLLKSRTKLHQQDEIWKNICKDLNWEFIKSL